MNCFLLNESVPAECRKQSRARDKFWPLASCFFQVVFHPLMYLNGIPRGCSPLPPKETTPPVSHADTHADVSGVFSAKHRQDDIAPTSHVACCFSGLLCFLREPRPSATAPRNQGLCLRILQSGREKRVIDAHFRTRAEVCVCCWGCGYRWLEVRWVLAGVDWWRW